MNFSDVFLVDKHIPISSVNGKKVAEQLLIKTNPSATSCHLPYILLCKTQRRRLILSDILCLSFFPAVYRSITGCFVSNIEKVARSESIFHYKGQGKRHYLPYSAILWDIPQYKRRQTIHFVYLYRVLPNSHRKILICQIDIIQN